MGNVAPKTIVLLNAVVSLIDLLPNINAVDKPHCILLSSTDVEIVKLAAGINLVTSVSPCIFTAVIFTLLAFILSLPVLFMKIPPSLCVTLVAPALADENVIELSAKLNDVVSARLKVTESFWAVLSLLSFTNTLTFHVVAVS